MKKQRLMITDTVALEDINPTNGDKYSPNLYKFMRARLRDCNWARWQVATWSSDYGSFPCLVREWTDSNGVHLQMSAKLWEALCRGSKTCNGFYPGRRFTFDRPNFWDEYKAIGRCAIDPEHRERFVAGDRWEESADGQTRRCRWCGKVTQRLEHYTEPRTRWVNQEG